MRIVVVQTGCPICHIMLRAVNMFNANKLPHHRIEVVNLAVYYPDYINVLKYHIFPKEEIEKGYGVPFIVFDDFVFKRREIDDGIDHPKELLAMFEELHAQSLKESNAIY